VEGNRNTWRKPEPVPHCLLHIPHDLTWDRTQAAEWKAGKYLPELWHGHQMNININHSIVPELLKLLNSLVVLIYFIIYKV
jgi:hypothetical protein